MHRSVCAYECKGSIRIVYIRNMILSQWPPPHSVATTPHHTTPSYTTLHHAHTHTHTTHNTHRTPPHTTTTSQCKFQNCMCAHCLANAWLVDKNATSASCSSDDSMVANHVHALVSTNKHHQCKLQRIKTILGTNRSRMEQTIADSTRTRSD